MRNFFYRHNGSVSIALTLILLPSLILGGVALDGTRVSAGKSMLAGAGDLAINAGLAQYDQVLHDMYGLFATSLSEKDLEKNLKAYFTATLTGEDSHLDASYVDQLTSLITDAIMGSSDGTDFTRIVQFASDSIDFNVVLPEDSAIIQPDVMKRQIVEYMKYRGPVVMGAGILDKFTSLGGVKQEKDCVDKEIIYTESLGGIQEAMQKAYDAVNQHIFDIFKYQLDVLFCKQSLERLQQNMVYFLTGVEILKYPKQSISITGGTAENASIDATISTTQLDLVNAALKAIFIQDDLAGTRINLDAIKEFIAWTNGQEQFFKDYMVAAAAADKKYKDECDRIDREYETAKQVYEDNKKKTPPVTPNPAPVKETYPTKPNTDTQKKTIEAYQDAYAKCFSELTTQAEAYVKDDLDTLGLFDDFLNEAVTRAGEAADALEAIIPMLDKAQEALKEWEKEADALPDGEVKTAAKSRIDDSAEMLDEDQIGELRDVCTGNRTVFLQVVAALRETTYDGSPLARFRPGYAKAYVEIFKERFSGTSITKGRLPDEEVEEINANYHRFYGILRNNCKVENLKKLPEMELAALLRAWDQGNPEQNAFLLELEHEETQKALAEEKQAILNNIGTALASESEKNKTDAQNKDKSAKEAKEAGNNKEDPQENPDKRIPISLYVDYSFNTPISPIILGRHTIAGAVEDYIREELKTTTNLKKSASQTTSSGRKIANKSDSVLSQIASLPGNLDDLASLGRDFRDSLYLTCYYTEMFSCLTSGYDKKGTKLDAEALKSVTSLSDYQLSCNPYFGQELEYILFGLDNPNANVAAACASIYGLRFVLNLIYAVTNSEIRSSATAMATIVAGWIPFGVPVMTVAITLALVAAETAMDLKDLTSGKDVPIYKNPQTWRCSASGMFKAAADEAIDKLAEEFVKAAGSLVEDVLDYANKTVDNLAEQLANDFATTLKGVFKDKILDALLKMNNSNDTIQIGPGENTPITALKAIGDGIESVRGFLNEWAGNDTIRTVMASTANGYIDTAEKTLIDELTKTVENFTSITYVTDRITGPINVALDAAAEGVTELVKGITKEITEKLKESVGELTGKAVGDAREQIKVKLGGVIERTSLRMPNANLKTNANKIGKSRIALTMNYKEYMSLFILLGNLAGNEENMLRHSAMLMQANISTKKKDWGYIAQRKNYDITKGYTMIGLEVTASVNTNFFALDFSNLKDTTISDFVTAGTPLKYVGMAGY